MWLHFLFFLLIIVVVIIVSLVSWGIIIVLPEGTTIVDCKG
jgi:hypothetical protein